MRNVILLSPQDLLKPAPYFNNRTFSHWQTLEVRSIGCRCGWIQVCKQFIRKMCLSPSWSASSMGLFYFSDRFSLSDGGRCERRTQETGKGQIKEQHSTWFAKRLGFYPQAWGDLVKNLKWEVTWADWHVSSPHTEIFPRVVLFLCMSGISFCLYGDGYFSIPKIFFFSFFFGNFWHCLNLMIHITNYSWKWSFKLLIIAEIILH